MKSEKIDVVLMLIIIAWWPRLHSFCIGLQGAPDLIAAKKVADFLGTVHHEFYFTVQEGIDALRDVIYHLETYDVTTVSSFLFFPYFIIIFYLVKNFWGVGY